VIPSSRKLLYYLSFLVLAASSDTFQYAFMCQSKLLAYNFTWRLRSNTNYRGQSTAITPTLTINQCAELLTLTQTISEPWQFSYVPDTTLKKLTQPLQRVVIQTVYKKNSAKLQQLRQEILFNAIFCWKNLKQPRVSSMTVWTYQNYWVR